MKRRTVVACGVAAAACSLAGLAPAAESTGRKAGMKLEFEGGALHAELADNAAAQELLKRLPLELDFLDLYGRELCHRLADALPADDVRERGYDVGEIIYWPPRRSFVIMYAQNGETFAMQSIGRITGSLAALPRRNVRIRLSRAD